MRSLDKHQDRPSLSAIIITKNEERCIAKCLESVKWVDEIIVLDSGSTDRTVEICRKWTPNVYETDWPGYGVQKGRALAKATCDWVLSIDADEVVSGELRSEIEASMQQDKFAAYRIPHLNNFCGQIMRHGTWWPDAHPRLARRDRVKFNDRIVHEGMVIEGRIGMLKSPFFHDTAPDLETFLGKRNLYSSLSAEIMFNRGRTGGIMKAVTHGSWAFFRMYVIKRGFLDGRMGIVSSVIMAMETFYKYVKLWLLYRPVSIRGEFEEATNND